MPRAKRGEIWMADLGLAAKVRPVLVLSVAYEGGPESTYEGPPVDLIATLKITPV